MISFAKNSKNKIQNKKIFSQKSHPNSKHRVTTSSFFSTESDLENENLPLLHQEPLASLCERFSLGHENTEIWHSVLDYPSQKACQKYNSKLTP